MYSLAARDSAYATVASGAEKFMKLPSNTLNGISFPEAKSCASWRPLEADDLPSSICAMPSFSQVGQRLLDIWETKEWVSSCLRTRASSGVTLCTPLIGMRSLPSLIAPLQEGAWVTSKNACCV